ncbi:hypothetical protein [Stutzerimonas nitrititolerans]|uniref:hypothetical protein n=1 Tax=Stutzerimonas nitrititolerans TaxID=2482751 RepID=UPI0028A6FFA8|nr:hypothetical protein [Stutzerimonas nitrititolerans]
MPWYSQGQVAVTANSATVTGTGTAFSANARVGDAFRGPDGRWYEITNIASATVLSIRPNYQGATASGQAYTIAPMQGYVKESADRLRQLVDQFGSQLAALQPWATAPTPAQAREALGANDAASLTAGLLDVARIPATLTPDKAYRRGNILGTVSQAGGVPTGAIIERGSNTNGEYIRWADGTQECWRVVGGIGSWTAGLTLNRPWTFPATFANTSAMFAYHSHQSAAGADISSSGWDTWVHALTTSGAEFGVKNTGAVAQSGSTQMQYAKGRWY